MNRGIARRTIFEGHEDVGAFVEQLAEASGRGEIEVHSYSLMTTHYHLLVRSTKGVLAEAMQRVQTDYSRWFNRRRRRDGPLVRGRYLSKEVKSYAYRLAVVSYIDRNPVSAGLVSQAAIYPHGSARAYSRNRLEGGEWLERSWVESEVCRVLDISTYDPLRYSEVFGGLSMSLARVVEARLRSQAREDPLDDLIRAAPDSVAEWMGRKARLADGSKPGLPVVAPEAVEEAVQGLEGSVEEAWKIGRRSAWLVLRVGLMRQLGGLSLEAIGDRVGLARSGVGNITGLHLRLLESDTTYSQRAGVAASLALRMWESGGK